MAVKEQADKDGIPFRYLQVYIHLIYELMYVLLECFKLLLQLTVGVCFIRMYCMLTKYWKANSGIL